MRGILLAGGGEWYLFRGEAPGDALACRGEELSEEILACLAETTGLQVLFAGEIVGLETACPTRGNYAKAAERFAHLAAETLGREDREVVALPQVGAWRGHRGNWTLVAPLERARLEALNEVFGETATTVAGYASLELALFDWWKRTGEVKAKTLLVVAESTTFIVPAAHLGNPGPHTISGGSRHFVQDPPSWTARLLRELGSAQGPVALLALDRGDELARVLGAEGVGPVERLEPAAVLAAVNTRLATLRRESLRAPVPIVHPFASTRLFSSAWTVLAALVMWLGVFAVAAVQESALARRKAELVRASEAYLPLEAQIKAAEKSKAAATAELGRAEALKKTLIARRRPLDLFINVAYFFCRNSGATVQLESLLETADALAVEGTFLDPEDGVRLTEKLTAFLKEKSLALARIDMRDETDERGRNQTRFTCVITAGGGK